MTSAYMTSSSDVIWRHEVTMWRHMTSWRHPLTEVTIDVIWWHDVTLWCHVMSWLHHVTSYDIIMLDQHMSLYGIMWHHSLASCQIMKPYNYSPCHEQLWSHNISQQSWQRSMTVVQWSKKETFLPETGKMIFFYWCGANLFCTTVLWSELKLR